MTLGWIIGVSSASFRGEVDAGGDNQRGLGAKCSNIPLPSGTESKQLASEYCQQTALMSARLC